MIVSRGSTAMAGSGEVDPQAEGGPPLRAVGRTPRAGGTSRRDPRIPPCFTGGACVEAWGPAPTFAGSAAVELRLPKGGALTRPDAAGI